MFDTIIGFSNQLLSAIVLVLCAGVTSHIIHGYGTKKSKDTFVGLVLLLAAGCQVNISYSNMCWFLCPLCQKCVLIFIYRCII